MRYQSRTSNSSPEAPEDDLTALVIAAQNDPHKHFDDLYAATWQTAYGIALSLVKSTQDAENITQQAFVNAYRHLKRLNNPDSFKAWLSRIVVNLSNSHLNDRTKSQSYLVLEEAGEGVQNLAVEQALRLASDESVYYSPDASVQRAASQNIVREAIERLPHRQREVIILRYFADFSLAEIADILDITKGCVGAYLTRATERLRELLLESQEGSEDEAKILLLQALLPISLKVQYGTETSAAIGQNIWSGISAQHSLGVYNPSAFGNIRAGLQKSLRSVQAAPAKATLVTVISVAAVVGGVLVINAIVNPPLAPRIQASVQPANVDLSEYDEGVADNVLEDDQDIDTVLTPETLDELEEEPSGRRRIVAVVNDPVIDPAPPQGSDSGSNLDRNDSDNDPITPPDDPDTGNRRPAPTVGSIIEFGTWENQALEWRVLWVGEGEALLISEYVLSAVQYRIQPPGNVSVYDYANSDVRLWLDAFSGSLDSDELRKDINGDYAHLVSHTSLHDYLGAATFRRALAHPLATGLAIDGNGYAPYWALDSSVGTSGSCSSVNVTTTGIGVRPLIRLICE